MSPRLIWKVLLFTTVISLAGACAPAATPAAPTKAPPTAPAAVPRPGESPVATAAPTSVSKPEPAASPKPVASTPASAPSPKRGGALRVGVPVDPQTLDPHLNSRRPDAYVLRALYNGLLDFDKDLRLVPDLAESWDSPDSTTFVFKIRQGVKFQDGTDLDAAAIKANLTRIMDPNTKAVNGPNFAPIKDIQAPDKATLKLTLSTPLASLLYLLAEQASLIVSPTAIQKYGKDLARNPVGTGPFQFVEWKDGDHVTVKRFDGYWEKGLPYLDQMVFSIAPDEAVRLINLRSGNLDVMMDVPYKDVDALQQGGEWNYWQALGSYYEMRFNMSKPPFDNKALRQAVSYAIDRDAVVKTVLWGHGQPGVGPVAPTLWAFNKSQQGYTHDLNKARQKLAEGGQPNGFQFDMDVRNVPAFQRWAEMVKFQLSEVGIDAQLNIMETVALTQRESSKQFTANGGLISPRSDPDTILYTFYNTKGSQNIGYSSAKVDDLLDRARSTTNIEERKQLYNQAEAIIIDDAPRAWIAYYPETAATAKAVQGFVFVGDGTMRLKGTWLDK